MSGKHGVALTLRRWIDAMLRCDVELRSGSAGCQGVVEHGGGLSTL
jgi:hypothetical protein